MLRLQYSVQWIIYIKKKYYCHAEKILYLLKKKKITLCVLFIYVNVIHLRYACVYKLQQCELFARVRCLYSFFFIL